MKKISMIVCVAVSTLLLSGCAMVKSPLTGIIYTNVKAPLAITNNTGSTKVGSAMAQSILGIAATGDASIEAAAKAGGITKIHHVDEECMSILGIYATYKVYVYGE